jgi:rhodanese-related sulfurtransferase
MQASFRNITKERLAQIRGRKEVLVADVRTPEYFRNGTISGAVNLYPTRKFVNELHRLSKEKKRPIIIFGHDLDDAEAKAGATYAEQLGFENIYVTDFRTLRED